MSRDDERHEPGDSESPSEPVGPLVSSAWLAGQIGRRELRVLDATWALPGSSYDVPAQFRSGHIPGALPFDIDAVADPEASLPHMAPTAARFERLIGALGVRDDSFVVFYDQQGLACAARGWWLMRMFGLERCAVLDGGLPKWRAEGRALERGDPAPASTPEPEGAFNARFNARYLRGLGDMLENLRSHRELVLDARSAERFDGRAPEPRPNLRRGHIPGSRSLPYTELLGPDQTLRPAQELRGLFGSRGVDAQRAVVCSCGSGVTAAVLCLGLEVAGWPAAALYDGSWSEWGGRTDTPVES